VLRLPFETPDIVDMRCDPGDSEWSSRAESCEPHALPDCFFGLTAETSDRSELPARFEAFDIFEDMC
jgi:hypothetical protein